MKYTISALLGLLLGSLMLFSCASDSENNTEASTSETETKELRIVSLNGTLTELLYACNLGDKIVGVDVTSTYPDVVKEVANLGHANKLNAEAILALKPNLVLIDAQQKDNKVLEQIKAAGIQTEVIDIPQELNGALSVAESLETVLDQEIDTKELEATITKNTNALSELLAQHTEHKPKVLFIYARGARMMMVAGKNTFAETMITLAGGTPIAAEFESFKPLTPEALVEYQPDVVLMFDSGLASMADASKNVSGEEQLFQMPGMEQTPAGKNRRVITMEGLYLSGFGPRASAAALELATALHTAPLSMAEETKKVD